MRINKPLQELKLILRFPYCFNKIHMTEQAISIISNLDNCVENKNKCLANFHWGLLDRLLIKAKDKDYVRYFNELEDLHSFEKWELDFIQEECYTFNELCEVFYLKCADINIYRKIFLLENSVDVGNTFFNLARKIDCLREVFDDIDDVAEDYGKQCFNIVNISKSCHENWYKLIVNLINRLSDDAHNALAKMALLENISTYFINDMRAKLTIEKACFLNLLSNCHNTSDV